MDVKLMMMISNFQFLNTLHNVEKSSVEFLYLENIGVVVGRKIAAIMYAPGCPP